MRCVGSRRRKADNNAARAQANRRPLIANVRGASTAGVGHNRRMQATLLRELHARRFSIRARWETLLRAEPIATPLGTPDALVHLIDTTMQEVLTALEQPARSGKVQRQPQPSADTLCPCGRNPLLAYFAAAGQAFREGLVLAQAASAPLDPRERDAAFERLNAILGEISRREVEAFCGLCQFSHLALPSPAPTLALCSG